MLTQLNMHYYTISIDNIIKTIQNNKVTELEICYLDLGTRCTAEDQAAFCAALRFNTNLEYLGLSNNNIDDNFALMIVEALKYNKDIQLDLSDNNISPAGAEAITAAFANNSIAYQKLKK